LVAERQANGEVLTDFLPNVQVPFGLRTVDGSLNNLVFKYPGWRAREGFSQPALGVPGEPDDPLKGG